MDIFFEKTREHIVKKNIPSLKHFKINQMPISNQYEVFIIWGYKQNIIYTRTVFENTNHFNERSLKLEIEDSRKLYDEMINNNHTNFVFLLRQIRIKYYFTIGGYRPTNSHIFDNIILDILNEQNSQENFAALNTYNKVVNLNILKKYSEYPEWIIPEETII